VEIENGENLKKISMERIQIRASPLNKSMLYHWLSLHMH